MTIHEAGRRLLFQLYDVYDNNEAENITDWVMEHITGWKRIDRLINKNVKLSARMESLLEKYTAELQQHKPVQYVLNEAWFCGLKFFVNEHVLIPRPETEELVDWILKDELAHVKNIRILDVGTGSGCIAISLKKKLPSADIYACDISPEALKIAGQNALDNNVTVSFLKTDILEKKERKELPPFDIIVSNPPYIPRSEENTMNNNVVGYEPHIALFVAEDDPSIFYRAIADIPAKVIFAETHEELAQQTAAVFSSALFKTEIRKDMQGKERMLKALLLNPGLIHH